MSHIVQQGCSTNAQPAGSVNDVRVLTVRVLRCCSMSPAEGVGDPSDPKYSHLPHPEPRGATHTGGAPIEFGGPGKRHVSDQAKGGPIHGGSKTTFTTMG